MKKKIGRLLRVVCLLLALCMISGALAACSGSSEIPDGYQYATCSGEYFRLFVPTQWTVNTESGISSAYISLNTDSLVSMTEVYYYPATETEADLETTVPEDMAGTSVVARAAESGTVAPADRSGEATLEAFSEKHLADISTMDDFVLDENKTYNSTLAGKAAKEFTYTAELAGQTYKFRQILTKVDGRFYVFTYSSLADAYDIWLTAVDEMLQYVTFTVYPYDGEHERKIPDDIEAPDGMKLVSTNEVAFRFYAPESWTLDAKNKNCLVYFSEEDRSNVSIMGHSNSPEGYSVDDYWEDCSKQYADVLDSYILVSVGMETTLGGRNAKVYEYTYSVGGVDYHARQIIAVKGGMVYVMTYTALPAYYDSHLDDVEQMREAFSFRSWGD